MPIKWVLERVDLSNYEARIATLNDRSSCCIPIGSPTYRDERSVEALLRSIYFLFQKIRAHTSNRFRNSHHQNRHSQEQKPSCKHHFLQRSHDYTTKVGRIQSCLGTHFLAQKLRCTYRLLLQIRARISTRCQLLNLSDRHAGAN